MAVNKFAADCTTCSREVPANGGKLTKVDGRWIVNHLACSAAGRPQVIEVRFGSGDTVTVNSNGRCEDAPCCGCCT